jgi:hypothetical protein
VDRCDGGLRALDQLASRLLRPLNPANAALHVGLEQAAEVDDGIFLFGFAAGLLLQRPLLLWRYRKA